jgi:hypothetical protein
MNEFKLGIPAEEYHKLPGLSSTGLKNFAISPSYYRTMREAYREREQEEVLIHTILESDELFESQVKIVGDKRTKVGKEAAAEAKEKDLVPISQEQYDRFNLIRLSVLEHPEAGPLVKTGQHEVSLFWDHPQYGFPCRGRVDLMNGSFLIDYKNVGALLQSPDDLEWFVYRSKIHWQSLHYLDGFEAITGNQGDFVLLFIDHRAGWRVRHPIEMRTVPFSSIDKARQDTDQHYFRYNECFTTDDFSGISDLYLPAKVTQ